MEEWNEEIERAEFEKACYTQYVCKKAAGALDLSQDGDGSQEALFWRQPDGDYGVLMFNAAWWGWCNAKLHERGLK